MKKGNMKLSNHLSISEKKPRNHLHTDYLRMIVELGNLKGWVVVYFRQAQVMRKGKMTYETPIGGDARGWLDVLAIRGQRIVAIEVKIGNDKLSDEQKMWYDLWNKSTREVYVLREPKQKEGEISWEDLVKILE